jgi:hypothetical protein
MAVMPSPPPYHRRHSENQRRKGASAAAVADDDDPAGGNVKWNAQAVGAAMMASSRAMDAAAGSEAFVGVSARLLLLMVMVCSTIPRFLSHLLGADRLRADASRCFVPTLSVQPTYGHIFVLNFLRGGTKGLYCTFDLNLPTLN